MTALELEHVNIVRVENGKLPLTKAQAERAMMNWSSRDLSLHLFLVRFHSVNSYRPEGRTLKRSEVEI